MQLSMNAILEDLRHQFSIQLPSGPFPHDRQLQGAALLTSAVLEPQLLYVTDARRLPAHWKAPGPAHLVILGTPPTDYFQDAPVQWICVEDNRFALVFNAILEIFRRYNTLEQSLHQMLLAHEPPELLCQTIGEFLDSPIVVFDTALRLCYCSDDARSMLEWESDTFSGLPVLPTEFLNQVSLVYSEVAEDFVGGAVLLRDDRLPYNLLCTLNGSNPYIVLILEQAHPLNNAHLELLAAVNHAILQAFEAAPQRRSASNCLSSTILSMLEGVKFSPRELSNQLGSVGWTLGDNYCCIVMQGHSDQNQAKYVNTFCLKLENWFTDCVTFTYQDQAVAVVKLKHSGCDVRDIPYRIGVLLRDGLLNAGISFRYVGFDMTPVYYQQARSALDMGKLYNPSSWCYLFEDYALYYFMHYGSSQLPPRHLCHPALVQLYSYDQVNGTDLLHTLETYVCNNCNAVTASNLLYIHRNTFYQRMNKIQELVQLNLEDQKLRLYLQLSIQLIAMYYYELDNGFSFPRE